ncbi:MAG: hypothetical protein H6741_05455 [Alphaproteobacteria bacterium]|nr:hypothetical protein [Alphaproteobacteria bacterium]MCB9792153.1 hypothetical protein [Alphaproteobacteria bacterium]
MPSARSAITFGTALAALFVAVACFEPANPCDEYVDYICDCHADDDRPGYDCQTLRRTYENADADLQTDCQIAYDEQLDVDADEGFVCAGGGDTGDSGF